jgi:hypothetical protein
LVSGLTQKDRNVINLANFRIARPCAMAMRRAGSGHDFGSRRKRCRTMSDEPPTLPPILAEQIALLRAQFDPADPAPPDILLRVVDAVLLNLCEYAEADMALLNRIMGMRAAADGAARSMEDPEGTDPAEARARLAAELDALVVVLSQSQPSAMARAMGLAW